MIICAPRTYRGPERRIPRDQAPAWSMWITGPAARQGRVAMWTTVEGTSHEVRASNPFPHCELYRHLVAPEARSASETVGFSPALSLPVWRPVVWPPMWSCPSTCPPSSSLIRRLRMSP